MKSVLLFGFFFALSNLHAADWFAYAADSSSFQIITYDIQTNTPGASISVGRSQEVAITPDASTLYVINRNITSSVSVIDLATQTVINTIFLNDDDVDQQPFGITITPDGLNAYITTLDSSNVSNVLKLDLASGTYTVIPLTPDTQSDALAITPDGSMIYFTQTAAVVGMATATNVFSAPIPIAGRSTRIAITPSGLLAYVTDMINNRAYEIDLTAQSVSATIPLTASSQPSNIAISSDGLWAYIANGNATFATAINLDTYVTTDIIIGVSQDGVAITPDSKTAVFSNQGGAAISTIEVGTSNTMTTAVQGNPSFLAITPDQAPIASFTTAIGTALTPSTFTSTSTTDVGTLALYEWDFGDGNTVSTATNPIQHTYMAGGAYDVILTVTNSGGTSTTQTFTGQTVSNNGGPSATTTSQINVPFVAPVITSVTPATGPAGTAVQISGSGFTGTTSVTFGALSATFTVISDTQISVVVPAGFTGTVLITVTTPGGIASIPFTLSNSIAPPTNLTGVQIQNKFASQTDVVNILSWTEPVGITPAGYIIYSNAALTELVAATSDLSYEIHNRQKHKTYTYYVVSATSSGEISSPVSVTIN